MSIELDRFVTGPNCALVASIGQVAGIILADKSQMPYFRVSTGFMI
jgi:hypothetical protein